MALSGFERQLLAALKQATGNRKLKERDLLEWRAGKDSIKPREGEKTIWLDLYGVTVAIPSS
jgi:hypothetical protein